MSDSAGHPTFSYRFPSVGIDRIVRSVSGNFLDSDPIGSENTRVPLVFPSPDFRENSVGFDGFLQKSDGIRLDPIGFRSDLIYSDRIRESVWFTWVAYEQYLGILVCAKACKYRITSKNWKNSLFRYLWATLYIYLGI
jgi:hypothetical protein